ncbi:ABC transporter permease, partial [Lactobacillus sp. XV13L]|nr:ABC transporter permease [Lactobacillus sp. XV13L]
ENEIALADHYHKRYQLGQHLSFTEKKNVLGSTLLKRKKFRVVGFVRSSQILSSVNLGQSNSGTGELKGYAVVASRAFNQTVYTAANLTYRNLRGLDSYGSTYTARVSSHKKDLQDLLKKNARHRQERINQAVNRKLHPQEEKLRQAKRRLQRGKQDLTKAARQLANKQEELAQKAQAAGTSPELNAQLQQAQAELARQEKILQGKKELLGQKAVKTEAKISAGERKIARIKKQVQKMPRPSYSVYNRREVPGGEGNLVYTTVAQVVEDLAKVFPIFLYFVAALVTFTTMNRFIDEERINSGTLKALGYDDFVVINKFIFYGFLSGTIGTIIGIFLGHTLMPQIVYHAYYQSLT